MDCKRFLCAATILSVFLYSCGGGGGSPKSLPKFKSGDNEITDYKFTSVKNSSKIPADIQGVINGDSITITVPHASDISSLVAEYVTNSTDVEVNNIPQVNGESVNDFTTPVIYNVTAENGNARSYTVTVVRAPSTEKKILTFSINGTEGAVDEQNGIIKVALPPKSSLTGKTASFTAICGRVEVNGTAQVSGETQNDFTSPVVYSVIAEDGSSRDYTVNTTVTPAPWKEITSFEFRKTENPSLPDDISGTISGDTINVELPYGASVSDLTAYFTTTGEKVMIGSVEQYAGATKNTYDKIIEYKVLAEDTSEAVYIVDVTVAKSDAKSISSFKLDGEFGVVDQGTGTITLDFPATKSLSWLTAEFVTTGVSVTVNGIEQVSGITPNDFTSPVVYNVKADNNSTAQYTVNISKDAGISGLWNFDYTGGADYTLYGANVTQGLSGNALLFDGYDDYVIVPDSDMLTLPDSGTVEVVLKVISHRLYAGIVHKGVKNDFSDESYSLQYWGNDGTVRFLVTGNSGVYSYTDSSTKLVPGVWYHIVATWDQSTVKLYINGSLSNSSVNNTGMVRDSTGGLVIGAQLSDRFYNNTYRNLGFNGVIDRVQLFSRAIAPDEVVARYNMFIKPEGGALTAFLLKVPPRKKGIVIVLFICVMFTIAGLYIFNRFRHKNSIVS